MTRPGVRTSRLTAAVLAAGLLAGPGGSRAAAADVPATAVVLFVSYGGIPNRSLDPTRLRLAASGALADRVAEPGRAVVTWPDVEPILRDRRTRSERDVDAELVQALASGLSADRIVVSTLTVHPDRIQLLARGLHPGTDGLAWVDAVEARFPGDSWSDPPECERRIEAAVTGAAADLRPDWSAPAPAGAVPLVVLPIRAEGTRRGLTDLVSSCLLRSLLAHGWPVPDPAVAAAAVREAGFHPLRLEAGSRRLLAERFGADLLVVPRLIPFPPQGGAAPDPAWDADAVPGLSFELGNGVPFHLSVALVRCDSGEVVEGTEIYLAPDDGIGIFGLTNPVPAVRRFEQGADRIVASLFGKEGETPE